MPSPGEREVLLGDEAIAISEPSWAPFDDRVLSFLADLSRLVMSDSRARHLPDVVALGFWCRKSSLDLIKSSYPSHQMMMGRGLAFHVPPANVPLNFAYSLICGLLAGNSNIVRLSTTEFPEVDALLEVLAKTFQNPDHQSVARRICLVRYGHDDATTLYYSLLADARVIWGGDKTVTHIRGVRSKPRTVDVAFADRVSLALLSVEKVANLTDEQVSECASRFVADTYTFDQNACSSPKLVVWHGADSSIEDARLRFWPAVERIAAERNPTAPVKCVSRFVELCEMIANTDIIKSVEGIGSPAVRLVLQESKYWELAASLRFGTFSEACIADLRDLRNLVDDRVQTVGYFGYEASELRSVVPELSLAGIDRVVPLGQALAFDILWDGYDLISFLARRVVVR
jgi:hypothetical protein